MCSKDASFVTSVRRLMRVIGLKGEIICHQGRSGKTTEQAERALEVPRKLILKVLLFKSRERHVVAMVTGDRRVDVKNLERLSGVRGLRLAKPEEIERFTGFSAGGLPPFIFKNLCPVFVDEEVAAREYVIGSAGSEYVGVRFLPYELRKLGYRFARIT
jgi:Ala-tRNA(Pro) deacylase